MKQGNFWFKPSKLLPLIIFCKRCTPFGGTAAFEVLSPHGVMVPRTLAESCEAVLFSARLELITWASNSSESWKYAGY